jgi:serine/threonine protein kinase
VDRVLLPNVVRFGIFELDLRARELRKNGQGTGLPEQSIKILALLVEKPGDVVLREEIRRKLWPNDTVVEFDHSINAAIKRLRQALNDPADNPEYIETLPRRGYRWIPPVERQAAAANLTAPVNVQDATSDTHNLIGRKVSHYRVLELLGGGGMGVVYKAEDLKLGRHVALKFLPEELASDPAALQRFESEARAASALNHPNICTIYEVEEYAGQPFIVMELLDGQTLRDVLATSTGAQPPFELSNLRDLAIQITAGLEAAHQKGIVHRDIKPANIFVTSDGQAKILDFGLAKFSVTGTTTATPAAIHDEDGAKLRSSLPIESLTASSPFLSRTGVAVGTAGYMSPEQIRGENLDTRTDLFSLGLVLYEIATGQRAFIGNTATDLQDAILNKLPTPAKEINPSVPAKLGQIIQRALEKNREQRYQTASEMRSDLGALKVVMQPHRAPKQMMAGAIAFALLLAAAIFWFGSLRPHSGPSLPEPKLRQLTNNSFENRVLTGAISPDGKYLAYSDAKGVRIQLVATGDTHVIPPPQELFGKEVDWEVTGKWFPDSARFVVNAHPSGRGAQFWNSEGSSIWIYSVLGGPPRKLRDRATAYSVSPDGSSISFGTNKGKFGDREIWVMGPGGENARKLFETAEESSIGGLSWSPDGKRVLYYKTDQSGDTILSRALENGPPSTVFGPAETKKLDDLLWSADGQLLYSVQEPESFFGSACNFWGMRLDGRTGNPTEKPRRLTNWSGFCMSGLSETSDGKNLAFVKWVGKQTSSVADLEPDGTRILRTRHFPLSESSEGGLGWTPDSKEIIFMSNRAGHYGLYRQSLDQDVAQPILTEGIGRNARVTPDGKSIVFLGIGETGSPLVHGPEPVMQISLTGGRPQFLFTAKPWSLITCTRAPSKLCAIGEPTEDGKQLILTSFDPLEGRGRELFRFPLIPHDDTWFLDISRDGTRFAVTQTTIGPIHILSLSGKVQTQFRVNGWTNLESFFWSPDGNGLFVTAGVHNGKEILHVDLHGNAYALWENSGGSGETEARPSPDGRHLVFNSWTTNANMWLLKNF